jgi:hypothetical protein
MDNEQEYRVPIKILTQRDPIIGGKLSMREMGQWMFFGVLLYLVVNILPLPLQVNLMLGAFILMGAFIFIHIPVNGLSGIEWIFIAMRYRAERHLHKAKGIAVSDTTSSRRTRRPAFNVTATKALTAVQESSSPTQAEAE